MGFRAVGVDVGPIVFAVILGWIGGDKGTDPQLASWLTAARADETLKVESTCRVLGSDFKLRQVRLDLTPMPFAEPTALPEVGPIPEQP